MVQVAVLRTHISTKERIGPVRASPKQKVNDKPIGPWYAVDGDWERWCREEVFGIGEYEYELVLGQENILRLCSIADLDKFHADYKDSSDTFERDYIDWDKVAEKFDGIEIAPYIWERRLHGPAHRWYYTWDCASGASGGQRASSCGLSEPLSQSLEKIE